uniref:hedgehog-interacting protein-like n=1 Tax=Myxine glutinosa TaxID=7769 RepID=UPI00358ED0EF
MLNGEGGSDSATVARVRCAWKKFRELSGVLTRRGVSLKLKGKAGDERGMLSLAFHPDFAQNGKLYVSYTTRGDAWGSGPHDHILRVSEFTVSRKSWRHVSRNSERRILDVAELRRAHLGGELLFGPDGLLYVVLGDGRITLDDMEEMDGLSDFTGSILRINVSVPGCDPPYAIPPDNPHANGTSHPPEAYTHGLRSPGRCSVTSAAWHGTTLIVCFESAPHGNASARLLHIQRDKDFDTEPETFAEWPAHDQTLVGGHFYHGCQSRRLAGGYVFGDRSGQLMWLSATWRMRRLAFAGVDCARVGLNGWMEGSLMGIGRGEDGEMYLLTSGKEAGQAEVGRVYRLVDLRRPEHPVQCRRATHVPALPRAPCPRNCESGVCSPQGGCCCPSGWEGDGCKQAKCQPVCQNNGHCSKPGRCLCKSGFHGALCEYSDSPFHSALRAGFSFLFGESLDNASTSRQ